MTTVLCVSACGTSREATRSEAYGLTAYELNRDSLQVTAYSLQDSLIEVTTITIDRNEVGDTLKHSIVTDRLRAKSREKAKEVEVRTVVKNDTVFIKKTDSVFVRNTNFTNGTNKPSGFIQTLRWIFGILICVIVLVIFIKVKRLNCG